MCNGRKTSRPQYMITYKYAGFKPGTGTKAMLFVNPKKQFPPAIPVVACPRELFINSDPCFHPACQQDFKDV